MHRPLTPTRPATTEQPAADPTRGYAAWLIANGLDVNLHTWNEWLSVCAQKRAA